MLYSNKIDNKGGKKLNLNELMTNAYKNKQGFTREEHKRFAESEARHYYHTCNWAGKVVEVGGTKYHVGGNGNFQKMVEE